MSSNNVTLFPAFWLFLNVYVFGLVAKSDDEEEEKESRAANSNPFPYEGIYIDFNDKVRIQSLSELEREAILGERQDELQKIRDRENVKNMVRARDEQSSKRSSGREKSRTGTTHEKAQKLDELKLKRQAKGKRPKVRILVYPSIYLLMSNFLHTQPSPLLDSRMTRMKTKYRSSGVMSRAGIDPRMMRPIWLRSRISPMNRATLEKHLRRRI